MTSTTDPDIDRVNVIGIVTDRVETPIDVVSTRVPITDFDKPDLSTRLITLALLPDDNQPDSVFCEWETTEADTIVAYRQWRNPKLAIGNYLFSLEQHDHHPRDALDALRSSAPSLANGYDDWLESLTDTDRQRILLAQTKDRLEQYREGFPDPRLDQWERALSDGDWRPTDLDPAAAEPVITARDRIDDPDGRSCYYTTLQIYQDCWDRDDIAYCEGLTLPRHGGAVVEHAWLEVDGAVAEVTWPYHDVAGTSAVYYGTPIPKSTIKRRLRHRPATTTMLLDADAYATRVQRITEQAYTAGYDLSELFADPV